MLIETEKLIPLSEAAYRLRISWERARRRVLTGELEGRKIGGFWFVEAAAIERAQVSSPA